MFQGIKNFIAKHRDKPMVANMEKALKMKEAAGPQTTTPEHTEAHDNGVHGAQMGYTDTRLGKEGTWTENVGRSHGARVGDTGKTTGPGRGH
ncbi:hypothetical protein [Chthonobacter rhizosphaerae]|uniref:hypothetical protein n=1 Tax=Chthonobacter rhizosphaerae TaxID=2735553 RepID=UPI0015EF437B|nr:hypothetical protein [Chthonobacter rhizosphaerae]